MTPVRSEPERRESIDALRQILVGREHALLGEIETRLTSVEHQLGDEEALAGAITPLMHTAIRRQIHDARDEMIEALYPIIGALIGRSVGEAMRDLARQVDARVRHGFDPRLWWWRLRARVGGVPGDAIGLRAYLPFQVTDVFFIHRESGLLIHHAARREQATEDSEILSGMLTAIRDFVHDAFGSAAEGQLDEIQYGRQHIVLEAGRFTFLAVVVDGIEPPAFRADLRELLQAVERDHTAALRNYAGNAAVLAPAQPTLESVLATGQPRPLTRQQKLLLAGLAGFAVIAVLGLGSIAVLTWRALNPPPLPAPLIIAAPTPVPPTPVVLTVLPPTPPPTPAPLGSMRSDYWLRERPVAGAPAVAFARSGQAVEILRRQGDWLLVRRTAADGTAQGWVAAKGVADGGAPKTPTALPDND